MATIVTTGSGNWSSTTPDAPWPSGTIPSDGDDVFIADGHTVVYDYDNESDTNGVAVVPRGGGVFDLGSAPAGDYYLKMKELTSDVGCISSHEGSTGDVGTGRVIMGTDLDNGLPLTRTLTIESTSTVANSRVFHQRENPATRSNLLDVKLFDGLGHFRRHFYSTDWTSTGATTGELTSDKLIGKLIGDVEFYPVSEAGGVYTFTGATDFRIIAGFATASNVSTCTLDSITDNGDGTYTYALSGIDATTKTNIDSETGASPARNVALQGYFSNFVIKGDTAAQEATACVTNTADAVICASIQNFPRLTYGGEGNTPNSNTFYGAATAVQQLFEQGDCQNYFGCAFSSNYDGSNASDGRSSCADRHGNICLGLDENSAIIGYDEIALIRANNYSTQQGSLSLKGDFINIEKFYNYEGHSGGTGQEDRMAWDGNASQAGAPDTAMNMPVYLSDFAIINNANSSQSNTKMFMGYMPSIMENGIFEGTHRLFDHTNRFNVVNPNGSHYKNITINNVVDGIGGYVNADQAILTENMAYFFGVNDYKTSSNISWEDLTLDGVSHSFYLTTPGDSAEGHGKVETVTTGLPSGWNGSSAQKLTFWSGYAPMYIRRKVLARVGDTINASSQTKLDDAMYVNPRIAIVHEEDGYDKKTPNPFSAYSEGSTASAHTSTNTSTIEAASVSHVATRDGWHDVILVMWVEPDYDQLSAEKVAFATLTATASSGGGGGIIQSMTNSMVA